MKYYSQGYKYGTALALRLINRDPHLQLIDYNAPRYFHEIIEGKGAELMLYPMINGALGATEVDEYGISITINSNIKSIHKKNFTTAHEIGHLLFHIPETKYNCSYIETEETLGLTDSTFHKIKEVEANSFAANFMLPYKVLLHQILSDYTIKQIRLSTGLSVSSIQWQIINMLVSKYRFDQRMATNICEEYSILKHQNEVRASNLKTIIDLGASRAYDYLSYKKTKQSFSKRNQLYPIQSFFNSYN